MKMKKMFSIVLAVVLVLAFAGSALAAETTPAKKKILVVVDMQKDFVDGALGTAEAVAIVPNVVAKIEEYKKAGDTIIYTMDTHGDDYMDTQEGKFLPVPHCIYGTPGWELDAKVKAAMPKDAIEIQKPTFGSLMLPEKVAEYVKKAGGEQNVELELIGLCTDICVVSNAELLKANFYEMPISVDAKCCAGVTPESHAAALTTMSFCQITVTNND